MKYADGIQLYIDFEPFDRQSAVWNCTLYIADIKSLVNANKLTFNNSKTEKHTSQQSTDRTSHPLPPIKAWVGVRKVGHLRKFLNPLSSEKLVHDFITSHHLEYCNHVLAIVYYPAYQTMTYPVFYGFKMPQPQSLSVWNAVEQGRRKLFWSGGGGGGGGWTAASIHFSDGGGQNLKNGPQKIGTLRAQIRSI